MSVRGLTRSREPQARVRETVGDPFAGEGGDAPGGVEDEALGQLVGAVGAAEVAAAVDEVREGEAVAAHEFERVGGDVLVGDSDHCGAVALELPLEALQLGRLYPAGPYTRRPRS